ncbi:MAG: ATP synthase F0 subunit C [Planctomycetota bacterium]
MYLAEIDVSYLSALGKGLGAGIAILGAGLGIGRLAGSALEAMGRQPEAIGKIQTAMIIAAALIEGAAFFALVIVMGIK